MNEQVLAVQRMQDYIADNPEREVSLAELARVSLFSPWYAHRLFRAYTGLTPAEYGRRLRLSRSALRLKNGECRVLDAALDAGFDSVDGYQRAFLQHFGCNPGEYARRPVPIPLFTPYGAKFQAMRKDGFIMEKVQSVFIQVVHKPARQVLLKRGVKATHYFDYCEEVGCDIWGLLVSMDSLCGEPVCLWLPEQYRKPGTSTYVQGVEVPTDYSGPIPDGFELVALPAADYLMFQGEPFAEEDYAQAITAVSNAMDRYAPGAIGYAWDDANPRIQLESRGERGYIELRAVKKVG